MRLIGPPSRPVTLSITDTDDAQLVGLRDQSTERRLAAVIDAVADSTLLLDADGRLLWQSDALAARVPGGRANLGTHPVERLHPEDLPLVLENFAELARRPTGRVSQVVRSRAVDDDDVWQLIELIGAGRPDHPDLGGVVVQVRNLDEGAELESVAHTDGPLMSLAEAAPIGILLMNHAEVVVYANRASRDLLGLLETDDATRWRERVAPSHRGLIDAMITAGLAAADPVTTTAPFTRPEGSAHWLRVRVAPHLGASGQVRRRDRRPRGRHRRGRGPRPSPSGCCRCSTPRRTSWPSSSRPARSSTPTSRSQQVLERLEREGGSGRLVDLLGEASRDRFLAGAVGELEGRDHWEGEMEIQVGGGRTIPVSALGWSVVTRRARSTGSPWSPGTSPRRRTPRRSCAAWPPSTTSPVWPTGRCSPSSWTRRPRRASGRAGRWPCCSATSIGSRRSTTATATRSATPCCEPSPTACRRSRAEGDLAARVGGDEFVILCQGVTDSEVLAALAERIIDSIDQPIEAGDAVVKVGISIGIAVAGRASDVDGDRLLIVSRPGHVPGQGHRRQPLPHPGRRAPVGASTAGRLGPAGQAGRSGLGAGLPGRATAS